MPKKVTLKDIAAKAGLSPASVSMILNRRSIDRFNAETIEQVYAIAADLGYKSSKEKAYALVRPSDTLIIIICPSLFNPFYTTIIQGIEIAARKQGFVTSVRTTYWDTDTEKFIMEQARIQRCRCHLCHDSPTAAAGISAQQISAGCCHR